MVKAPEVPVAVSRAAIARAVEVIQSCGIRGIGGVVVEVCGRLVLKQEALGATRRLGVEAHRYGSAWLPVGKGTLRVSVPDQLLRGSVDLVEQSDVDLAANTGVRIWAAEPHCCPIHVIGGLGRGNQTLLLLERGDYDLGVDAAGVCDRVNHFSSGCLRLCRNCRTRTHLFGRGRRSLRYVDANVLEAVNRRIFCTTGFNPGVQKCLDLLNGHGAKVKEDAVANDQPRIEGAARRSSLGRLGGRKANKTDRNHEGCGKHRKEPTH